MLEVILDILRSTLDIAICIVHANRYATWYRTVHADDSYDSAYIVLDF